MPISASSISHAAHQLGLQLAAHSLHMHAQKPDILAGVERGGCGVWYGGGEGGGGLLGLQHGTDSLQMHAQEADIPCPRGLKEGGRGGDVGGGVA